MSKDSKGGSSIFVYIVFGVLIYIGFMTWPRETSNSRDALSNNGSALDHETPSSQPLSEYEMLRREELWHEAQREQWEYEQRLQDEAMNDYYDWKYDQLEDQYEAGDSYSKSSSCQCYDNLYNCDNFSSHSAAQACFERCWDSVGYDVHWLDGDGDAVACEDLLW